ncbi:MAG: SGNH/GDSL hydrolase family protein [Sorangiineae bacterium]|nr:SGNH/GDSL hydrolase family protein [Polyangiaceae bacterium]MEB2321195.1 SGNH/GDSL hydrolase family protein [Sorangiineae bacterium]
MLRGGPVLRSAALLALATGLLAGRANAEGAGEPRGSAPDRPTPKKRYVVAAIGDSLTDPRAGGGLYLKELALRCPESRFDAYGIGGQQTRHMRARFARDVFGDGSAGGVAPKPAYTHVLILGGVNDLLAGSIRDARVKAIEENLRAMYRTARERGVAVVALTIAPWGKLRGVDDRRLAATRSLDVWIRAQAAIGAVDHALDTYPLLSCGDPDELCPAYRRFADDSVHWGQRGHALVGAALFREVFPDCA